MGKTLMEMATEIEAVNREKGWYDKERSWGDDIALIHSEVSEILEAYQLWGVDDATPTPVEDVTLSGDVTVHRAKPEGVGAEAADVLIRVLDTARRRGIDFAELPRHLGGEVGRSSSDFGTGIADLHSAATRLAIEAGMVGAAAGEHLANSFASLLIELEAFAHRWGIDLEAEYERKLAYNRTRPYRHGGKRI